MNQTGIQLIRDGIINEIGHEEFTVMTHRCFDNIVTFEDKKDRKVYYVALTATGKVKKNSLRLEK